MSRQTRTMIIVAAIALGGLGTLGWLAQRYKAMAPMKSVHDLKPAPQEPAGQSEPALQAAPSPRPEAPPKPVADAGMERARVEVASPAASEEGSPPIASAAAHDVQAFIDVRTVTKQLVDESPVAVRQLTEQFENGIAPGAKRVPLNLNFLADYKVKRFKKMGEVGMTSDRYVAVRDAYTAWKDGQPVADADLKAALDAHRDRLEAVDLGDAERFDRLIGF